MENIIKDIVEARKMWEEKYKESYGEWGKFPRLKTEIFNELKGGEQNGKRK